MLSQRVPDGTGNEAAVLEQRDVAIRPGPDHAERRSHWIERRPQPPTSPRIVVSVGTDHHPFDRLIQWIDRWCEARGESSVLVQRGTSGEPGRVPSLDLIAHADLCQYFSLADVVISHGGPSTVMDARMVGRFPIVVPRDPGHGEHVDGHQMRFGDHLEKHGLARVVRSESEFVAALDDAMATPEAFAIGRARLDPPPGVVNFGASVDALLGIVTPIAGPAEREWAS